MRMAVSTVGADSIDGNVRVLTVDPVTKCIVGANLLVVWESDRASFEISYGPKAFVEFPDVASAVEALIQHNNDPLRAIAYPSTLDPLTDYFLSEDKLPDFGKYDPDSEAHDMWTLICDRAVLNLFTNDPDTQIGLSENLMCEMRRPEGSIEVHLDA